jgi:dephospho-CoA kinase
MINNFVENNPIIIGFSGKAGSGKTTVAESIVPKGSIESTALYGIKWDHIFNALPLYELSTIRRSIKGINERSRQLFAIHSTLFDIYGNSSIGEIPDYEDFVTRVHKIQQLPIEPEGVKPRSFLQKAGDICREGFDDCFAKWSVAKSNSLYRNYIKSLTDEMDFAPFAVLISDVRFINEAEAILKQPNGFVVCFDASKETLSERIMKRDGTPMNPEQMEHKSEKQVDQVKEIASVVINTDNMTIEQQTMATLSALGVLDKTNA